MRTTINIDTAVLKRAKRQARARRISLGKVVEDALRVALAARDPMPLPPFELITFSGGGAEKGVDLDRTSDLLAEEDELRFHKSRPAQSRPRGASPTQPSRTPRVLKQRG